MKTFISAMVVAAVISLLRGWVLMLAVGVAHAEWIHGLPTIGYWWAVLIAYLIGSALTPYTRENK